MITLVTLVAMYTYAIFTVIMLLSVGKPITVDDLIFTRFMYTSFLFLCFSWLTAKVTLKIFSQPGESVLY